MGIHLERDLQAIKKEILLLGAMVENSINLAVQALIERRPELVSEIAGRDAEIDQKEVHIEEECLKALALHQPVAQDLRFLVMVIKVNSDLERVGDHAVNMAGRATYLATHDPLPMSPAFTRMVEKVREMLRSSLDAIVNVDVDLARRVRADDDEVDRCLRDMFDHLQGLMLEDPANIKRAIHALSFCRNLERVADLATNIAEDLLFMAEGTIFRHRADLPPRDEA